MLCQASGVPGARLCSSINTDIPSSVSTWNVHEYFLLLPRVAKEHRRLRTTRRGADH